MVREAGTDRPVAGARAGDWRTQGDMAGGDGMRDTWCLPPPACSSYRPPRCAAGIRLLWSPLPHYLPSLDLQDSSSAALLYRGQTWVDGVGKVQWIRGSATRSNARTRVATSDTAVDNLSSTGVHGGLVVLLSMEKGRIRGTTAGCCCFLLLHYQIRALHLDLSSLVLLSAFALLCEAFVSITPSMALLLHFFSLELVAEGQSS
ncbi:hypothetical protein D1007_53796 [Hordeum vulgare]|nr:hypothetical protein D1007_53796 [Hordeum vulgare]